MGQGKYRSEITRWSRLGRQGFGSDASDIPRTHWWWVSQGCRVTERWIKRQSVGKTARKVQSMDKIVVKITHSEVAGVGTLHSSVR